MVVEESLTYSKVDFLGDLGGYTGIFIGASILTFYDLTISAFEKGKLFICKFKKKVVDTMPISKSNTIKMN